MKLIYLSTYSFPSKHAEPYYIRSMAKAFAKQLKKNFTLVVGGQFVDELKDTNAVSIPIPNRFKTVWFLMRFPRYVTQFNLNTDEMVVMTNDPFIACVCIIWRKIARYKYRMCTDWHQLYDDWKDSFLARNSDYLITTTKKLKNALMKISGVTEGKTCVVYGGVDIEIFAEKKTITGVELRKKLGLPIEAFLVGYAGGFRSLGLEKGLDLMIKALPYLDKNITVVLVGGKGPDIDLYTRMVDDLGVSDRCILIPRKQFDVLVEYEVAMDVLVIPYPNKHHFREYGFPMKVWEYMAAGKQIIYANLDIIAEVLKGKGVAFEPDSVSDLSRAITSVYTQKELLRTQAMENAQDIGEYTWDKRAEKIQTFIG